MNNNIQLRPSSDGISICCTLSAPFSCYMFAYDCQYSIVDYHMSNIFDYINNFIELSNYSYLSVFNIFRFRITELLLTKNIIKRGLEIITLTHKIHQKFM